MQAFKRSLAVLLCAALFVSCCGLFGAAAQSKTAL